MPQIYVIAQLPPTPQSIDTYPLLLSDEPNHGSTFYYGDQPLQLTYTYQETIVNNTQPTGMTTTKTEPRSSRLNCALWIACFGAWTIPADQVYTGQAIRDYETETERESRYFSGFKFNEESNIWRCTWEKQDQQVVFNSTFYYSTTVELLLNLVDQVGSYGESKYSSTAS